MKIRNGFVSNSSSSSFVILKHHLTEEQIDKIFNYVEVVEEYLKNNPDDHNFDFSYCEWGWGIKDFDDHIFGETSMDNFDFSEFLRYLNIEPEDICWDDGYNDIPTSYQNRFLEEERKKLIKIQRKEKLDKLHTDEK